MKNLITIAVALAASATFAGCGGGGSSTGSPTPITPATIAPTASATSTPTLPPASTPAPTSPTSAATTSPASVSITGTIVDYTSQAPVAGATVAIAAQDVSASPVPVATTAANGSFTAALTAAGPLEIQVTGSSTQAVIHRYVTVASTGTTPIGTLAMVALTTEDQSEIALINADRASHGGAAPVIPDEVAMEVARYHAADMAGNTGLGAPYYTHTDRNGLEPQQRYASAGGIGGDSETICAGGRTYQNCEAAYIAEGPPPAGSFNHYSIITNPLAVWVGVGNSQAAAVGGPGSIYYDEEYIQYPL